MKRFGYLILFICLTTLLAGCEDSELESPSSGNIGPDSLRYLALGDSYTIGQGIAASARWPVQLIDSLHDSSIPIRTPEIIAQTGWRTTDLIEALDNEQPEPADIVSLLIGVNDQYSSVPFEEFGAGFIELIDRSIELAGSQEKVLVVSIPDYGVSPFGSSNSESIAEEIDQYNAYIESYCDSLDLAFIDVTSISRALGDSEGALASDNLHPSAMQYSAWVEAILPIALGLLD